MKVRLFLAIVLVAIVVMTGSVITLAQGMIDINFATLEELQTLPGIGPEIAQAIIDGRPYMNKEDLQKVKGIDKRKFKRIQKRIVVKPLTINLATLDELKSLPGIDPQTAQAILDGRPYEKEEDLLQVNGMDEEKLKTIQNLIKIRLNINSASVYELRMLPGIGPKIAGAIVDGRPYTEVDELLRIRGISENKLAKIRDLLEIKVNINSATRDELGVLPGIEPKIAQAIIDGRPYKEVNELVKIKGIDEDKLAKIQDLIDIRLNINSVTLDELGILPGIGPQIAQAIIDGRPYTEVDELLRIKGIDEGKLAKIQDFVEAKPIDGERGRKLPLFPAQGGTP